MKMEHLMQLLYIASDVDTSISDANKLREIIISNIKEQSNIFDLSNKEIKAIKSNKKLDAIKLYKARTGCGLLEAKKYIEKYWDQVK